IFDNVALPLVIEGYRRNYIKKLVHVLLDEVNLLQSMNQRASTLSLGEKQRVAIARAMAKNPFVIIADEPTGNLDREASKNVLSLLEKINRNGTSVIMTTHDYELIKDTPYKRIYMENGEVLPGDRTINIPQTRINLLTNQE
ncbi:MAG: ATP-binding cassette domain-containing protein, partial [Candidatus Marinimicrobia bacterium]|nr:ATP-binding cassette domain-containing protein [Candidatus Neomarinimicrobiota bacterium]